MMDRISELPLHIIHQIMSHFSRKEVARTNLLSKTWKNNLRPSFPILAFNHEDFAAKGFPERWYLSHWYAQNFVESMEEFAAFVDATLDNFCKMNLLMLKFGLYIGIRGNFKHWHCLINKWVELALDNQVKDLDIAFWISQNIYLYTLPETLFSAKSITHLSLSGCKLNHPSNNSDAFRFHSLRILKLRNVSLDELMIQKLTSASPLLEYFAIWYCWRFEHCHIPKLERLKTLDIHFSTIMSKDHPPKSIEIEIEAPNLHYCTIDCYSIPGSSSIKGLLNCNHMRRLKLRGNLTTEEALGDLIISKIFPFLEKFHVARTRILSRIIIASQRLKQLKIFRCRRLEAIHIDTPNLRGFSFEGALVPIASMNAPCLGEFYVYNEGEVDTLWYLNLKKFLSGNSKHESLSVHIQLQQHSYKPEEFRRSSSSPQCQLQNLHLSVQMPESEYAALLDGFFSVCYPKTLSCHTSQARNFCMWLYQEILARRDSYPYRCDCSYVHCWRHYLKGIIQIKHHRKPWEKVLLTPDALINAGPDHFPDGRIDFALDWSFDVEKA